MTSQLDFQSSRTASRSHNWTRNVQSQLHGKYWDELGDRTRVNWMAGLFFCYCFE
ncbi:hypothetical protein RB213_002452, partial [Colletotrichum asianum]